MHLIYGLDNDRYLQTSTDMNTDLVERCLTYLGGGDILTKITKDITKVMGKCKDEVNINPCKIPFA